MTSYVRKYVSAFIKVNVRAYKYVDDGNIFRSLKIILCKQHKRLNRASKSIWCLGNDGTKGNVSAGGERHAGMFGWRCLVGSTNDFNTPPCFFFHTPFPSAVFFFCSFPVRLFDAAEIGYPLRYCQGNALGFRIPRN